MKGGKKLSTEDKFTGREAATTQAKNLADRFVGLFVSKFIRGNREHGGDFNTMSAADALYEAKNEVADLWSYFCRVDDELGLIYSELDRLRSENARLGNENCRLVARCNELSGKQTDSFAAFVACPHCGVPVGRLTLEYRRDGAQ